MDYTSWSHLWLLPNRKHIITVTKQIIWMLEYSGFLFLLLDEKALLKASKGVLHLLLAEWFLWRGGIISVLWKSALVMCPLLICVAALLGQLWHLNFSVWHSRAIQNIYKSPHATVIINLNNFAKCAQQKWTKSGMCLLIRIMFLSVCWGPDHVYNLWNHSSSHKWRMFLIRCQIRWNCGPERCWIHWVVEISTLLRWGIMLFIKKKGKCLAAIHIFIFSPVLP